MISNSCVDDFEKPFKFTSQHQWYFAFIWLVLTKSKTIFPFIQG